MQVASSSQLHKQLLSTLNTRQRTHTQNSPATSKISCHTSQLCAREVGIYKSSTSKSQTSPQDGKEIHTRNIQTTHNFTLSTQAKHSSSQHTYPPSNRVLTLGTCEIGPYCFRSATLIAEVNCRLVTLFNS